MGAIKTRGVSADGDDGIKGSKNTFRTDGDFGGPMKILPQPFWEGIRVIFLYQQTLSTLFLSLFPKSVR